MEQLVTVGTFLNIERMSVPKSLLESEGVECFVQNEFIGQIHPGFTLELQVKEKDAERSFDILKKGGFVTENDSAPSPIYKVIGRFLDKFRRK